MDAAGEFLDDLAANCLDTAVSARARVCVCVFPPWKMSKDQNASEKKGTEEK